MRTSGVDGLGPAAPAPIAEIGSAMGADARTVDAEHVPKVTRKAVYYDSESSCQENDQLLEFDFGLPHYEFEAEFSAIEKYRKLSCVHGHTPTRRVCREGFDIGRRFLNCPLKGYEACACVKWLDDEWRGRARSVITKPAEDNVKLNKKVTDLKGIITRLKQERINHRQQMKTRDKKELACVVVVAAFAIFYALLAMMIREFV